jgi:hypothetical protein
MGSVMDQIQADKWRESFYRLINDLEATLTPIDCNADPALAQTARESTAVAITRYVGKVYGKHESAE